MEQIKSPTKLERMIVAACTLTQEQIDACAWVMGAWAPKAERWDKGSLLECLTEANKQDIAK